MRLNKYIAHYSSYSRREADKAIEDGYVKIDGEVETNPATQVDEKHSRVVISGKKIVPTEQYTVIAYNKEKGELVTKSDPKGRSMILCQASTSTIFRLEDLIMRRRDCFF